MKPSGGLVVIAGVILLAPGLMAQKREDFIALQRDVAQLQDQLKQMQAEQDQKFKALETLIQQAVDASVKVNAGMPAIQDNLRNGLAEQQNRTAGALASINSRLNQVAEDIGAIKENVTDLGSRLSKQDSKLSDISTAVRTLSTPPPAPAAPNNASTGPCAGVNGDSLYDDARRDYTGGSDDLAMQEFVKYLACFAHAEHSPDAQYYQGMIFYRSKPPQYEDAIQAFDAVGERYEANPRSPEALYMKGVALMNHGDKTEAATEFRNFLKAYPNHPNAARAQGYLKTLSAAPAAGRGKKKQ